MVLNVALSALSSLFQLGWESAAVIVTLINGAYVGYIARHRDGLLLRVLVVAFCAGWVELLADWYAVDATRTLIYPKGEPFVFRSPLYMPLAWSAVIVQLGYVGWWVAKRMGAVVGSVATGLVGGVNIPIYEELARRAHWWEYRTAGVPALFAAPWYIIVAEALIALPLPLLMAAAVRRHLAWSVAYGIALGLWMWVATALAFAVIG